MATVVSHAMRRIATTPDASYSSCGIRSEKSRLSWNQETSESALSRSMRYADPWLYDGVRGGSGLLLAPALVLCSCQDYLNGTKRSSKNKKGPSTCKKCKGTRLPLSNGDSKFGTMRCYPTATLAPTPIRAGTVRVTSSSRPSILPSSDPYDLMRRSRLTVGDNGGSQFRARSVSPKKVRTNESRSSSASRQKPSVTKYSTVGRRSILECNVNPYELMSSEAKDSKDSAITLLNGQRIRVRPQISDYEDIERPSKTKTTSRTRPSSTSSSTSSSVCQSPKSSDKDAECGRFKSILKKPSAFSDTESGYEVSSSSPLQQRSGSHFYLPMPTPVNGPRKKVQFLVESERVSFVTNGDGPNGGIDDEDDGAMQGYQDGSLEDFSSSTQCDSGPTKKSCKLKRSESDRALKEDSNKVIFHDSMALRAHNYRTDSRIVFTDKDLEKLDGIYTSRFGKSRPTEPPPEPPKTRPQINETEYYEDLDEEDMNSSRKSSYEEKEYYEDLSESSRDYDEVKDELARGVQKLQIDDVCRSPKKKKVTYEDLEEQSGRKVSFEDEEDNLKKRVSYEDKPRKKVSYEDLENSPKKKVSYEDLENNTKKITNEDTPRKKVSYGDLDEPRKKVSYEDIDKPRKKVSYEDLDKPRKKISYEDIDEPRKKVSYEDIDEPRKKVSYEDIDKPRKKVSYEDLEYSKKQISCDDTNKPRKKVSYEDLENNIKKALIDDKARKHVNSKDLENNLSSYSDLEESSNNSATYEDLDDFENKKIISENKQSNKADCEDKPTRKLECEENQNIINGHNKKTVYYEDAGINYSEHETEKNQFTITSKIIQEDKPPSAPPRKRSSNKHSQSKSKNVSREEKSRKISFMENEVFYGDENNYEDVNMKSPVEVPLEIILPLDSDRIVIKTSTESEESSDESTHRMNSRLHQFNSILRSDSNTSTSEDSDENNYETHKINIKNYYDDNQMIMNNGGFTNGDFINSCENANGDYLKINETTPNYADNNYNNNLQDFIQSPNKTVLRINNLKSTVHKLKIKNEYPETNNINTIAISDNTLGKTSIMINGDDCYSTIKVCDEIPLYHSSVVVKDTGSPTEIKKSSSVYITGNFVNTFVNGAVKTFDETSEKEEDAKETEEVVLREKPTLNNLDLLKCLSDPVEAVRRNLVPHVCGKSDPPRRPKRGESQLPQIQTLSEEDKVAKFIQESFLKLRNNPILEVDDKDVCSEHSSSTQYEIMDQGSECYTDHSNRSSITEEELNARTKFYELLADSAVVEVSESEDHHYESIKMNPDPIYEEIEIPPPLPSNPPPSSLLDDLQLDKEYTTRSIFEGASKYDILSYLVDAKERGIVPEDSYTYNFNNTDVVVEEETKDGNDLPYNRVSHLSTVSDSSEDSSLVLSCSLTDSETNKTQRTIEVERNDSGVGSETSKSSLSKYRVKNDVISTTCEDCESVLENQVENEPLICRKCIKRRTERKEIITEIVETEEKYSRDLQIILEEFYQPMLVAGLLTSDQLSAIFLNVEELLENSQALAERLRDAVEIAIEQGDEDLLTVNIGKHILEASPMLHAFETYCVRQGPASLLLASLEKEKELLRIFLRVSQMENTVLRRMNLNSFLMVPVQRVTKYPLLLARLYKVTPAHQEMREQLKEAQHKIELHLNHMNSETKDVPSKLWRRISSIPGRRSSSEMDLVNIKLRKIAVDVLEWNHDEAKFALEGRLLFTQPTDNNWRKGRTIKLTPVNALLVTNGKSTSSTRTDPADESLVFSRQAGVRDAALLLVRDKNGRYSLLREPLYLDRCVIAADPAWQSYFEVQELLGKDTFIFKAEDEDQTKIWYRQLQYYAQGMGAWRKRRNALANIMINGMGLRS